MFDNHNSTGVKKQNEKRRFAKAPTRQPQLEYMSFFKLTDHYFFFFQTTKLQDLRTTKYFFLLSGGESVSHAFEVL